MPWLSVYVVPTLAQRTFPALRNTGAFPESFSRRILDEEGLARAGEYLKLVGVGACDRFCKFRPARRGGLTGNGRLRETQVCCAPGGILTTRILVDFKWIFVVLGT